MQDGIIAGNGSSRYLKTVAAALSLYPDYESFMAALIAGTFPIDLNGINADGWAQLGTPLNKANLFSDSTASVLGLTSSNTPNDALAKLKALIDGVMGYADTKAQIKVVSYIGTGTYGESNPCSITSEFPIKVAILLANNNKNGNQGNPGYVSATTMDDLTTKYKANVGLIYDSPSSQYTYSKRSSDYRTLTWYNSSSAGNQLNIFGYTYVILVIGG